ncbi:hypothetical protein IFM89_000053 [Coptis chinensis]|uniref:Uncharacterized protein n=1 Tax=Coptis chinensis TaxID=261450 RepID=A0A835IJ78_9MAGN|nr:hypothetical protein IFM89_000053 [Coptis chinensis]
MTPPAWYFSMHQNRFGTIATAWLLGNVMQSQDRYSQQFHFPYSTDSIGRWCCSH